MSLNRTEQMVADYVAQHPEEKRYWFDKVQAASRSAAGEHENARQLADDLWRYVEERSAVANPFRELAQREGLRRTSMRNLAEYWLRLWGVPRPKRPKAEKEFSGEF